MASNKQIILITGASSGIGLDTANLLATVSPNNHVIMGVRNLEKGEACLEDIQSRNPQGTLSLLQLDVADDTSITEAVARLTADYPRLDVLINNAGILPEGPMSRENFNNVFNTNVFGPALLTNALLPLLQATTVPKIINVTSALGSIAKQANPNDDSYDAQYETYRMSKAAMNMMSAIQFKKLRDAGGMVWSFCPGFVVTLLTGAKDLEWRKNNGGETSETSAQGILEILQGKRDAEVGGFITKYGKSYPW